MLVHFCVLSNMSDFFLTVEKYPVHFSMFDFEANRLYFNASKNTYVPIKTDLVVLYIGLTFFPVFFLSYKKRAKSELRKIFSYKKYFYCSFF